MVNLVYTYLTRIQFDIRQKTLEIRGSGGAIYLPYLVLHHTAWSAQKGMSTFKGLGTYSLPILIFAHSSSSQAYSIVLDE